MPTTAFAVDPSMLLYYPLNISGGIDGMYTPNYSSGYVIYDASFVGTATIDDVSGIEALYLPTNTAYLSFPKFSTSTSAFSISWWSNYITFDGMVFYFQDYDASNTCMCTTDGSNNLSININGYVQQIGPPSDFSESILNNWHHFSWVVDNDKWRLYIDTIPFDFSGIAPNATTYVKNTIGSIGYINDFRIYDYAIPPEKVNQLYTNLAMVVRYDFESCSIDGRTLNSVSKTYDAILVRDAKVSNKTSKIGNNSLYVMNAYTYAGISYANCEFTYPVIITETTGFSFCGWYHFESAIGVTNPLFVANNGNLQNPTYQDGIHCLNITQDGHICLQYSDASGIVFQDISSIVLPTSAYALSVWNHYALTISASENPVWSVYINGAFVASVTSPNIYNLYNTNTPITFGTVGVQNNMRVATPEAFYDDIRLYDRVLSATDINKIYSLSSNVFMPASNANSEAAVVELEKGGVYEPVSVMITEPEPEPVSVVVTEPEPIVVTEPEPIVVTEPEPIVVTEPEPIVVTEPEPVVVTSSEPFPLLIPVPVVVTEPEPEPEPVVE